MHQVYLVDKGDPDYLAWQLDGIKRYKKRRVYPRDPIASHHQELMRILESATLLMMADNHGANVNMVLKSELPTGSSFRHEFHEVDFTFSVDGAPSLFGELKIGSSLRDAAKTARKQLRKRVSLASPRWPNLRGIVLFYDLRGHAEGYDNFDETHDAIMELGSVENFPVKKFGIGSLYECLIRAGYIHEGFPEEFSSSIRMMKDPLKVVKCEVDSPNEFARIFDENLFKYHNKD